MQKYVDWKTSAVEYIDENVMEAMDSIRGDVDDTDILDSAASSIKSLLRDVDGNSTLFRSLANNLASEWIDYAYRNWYTGDYDKDMNLEYLMELIFR